MKLKRTRKVLSAVLIATVLVIGLASSALDPLDKSRTASAWGCYESMVAFHNANMGYHTARVSYFYDEPTTCLSDCINQNPWYTPWSVILECEEDCYVTRYTTLGQSDLTLWSASLFTCAPETVDQCVQARQMRDQCYGQYDPNNYSNPEEYLAEWSQLSACLMASKVHYCE